MKNNFLLLVILTVWLGLLSTDVIAQELPGAQNAHATDNLHQFMVFDTKSNQNYVLSGGADFENSMPLVRLNGVDITNNHDHPLDTAPKAGIVHTSLSEELCSFAGNVNLSNDIDGQFRVSYTNVLNGSTPYQITLRELPISYLVFDQDLYQDRYQYIAIDNVGSNTFIETEYSGFPATSVAEDRIEITGSNSMILRLDLQTNELKEYTFPVSSTRFGGDSFVFDNNGNVYVLTTDSTFDTHFSILGFDQDLNKIYDSGKILRNQMDLANALPLGYMEYAGQEFIGFFDGSFPGVINLSTGDIIKSSDKPLEFDWSDILNGNQSIESIKPIPGTNKFLITKTWNDSLNEDRSWFMVMDINGERSLYYRETITVNDNGNIGTRRPNITSSYFDSNGDLHFTAVLRTNGIATLAGTELTDGTQSIDDTIIYEGVIEGLNLNFPSKTGLVNFAPDGGSTQYDGSVGNDILFTGLSDISNVTVRREVEDGFTVFPGEETTHDFSNGNIVRSTTIDITGSQPFAKATIIASFIESAPVALSTESFDKVSFNVYPNPATEIITIDTHDGSNVDVLMYNLLGQKVFSKTNVFSGESIDVSNFSKGMYVLKFIKDGKLQKNSKKLILK